jgi:hypothetical protein
VLGLLWGAIASRRGQAAAVFGVTLLAVVAAAAAVAYSRTSAEAVARADATAAPARQRLVTVSRAVSLDVSASSIVDAFQANVDEVLAMPGATPTLALTTSGVATTPGREELVAPLLYRDGFCGHARIVGSCPERTGEVLVSAPVAEAFGIRVGDELAYHVSLQPDGPPLRVVGSYARADPLDPYWLSASTAISVESSNELDEPDGPLVTTLDTIGGYRPENAVVVYDAFVPVELFVSGYDVPAELARAQHTLSLTSQDLATDAGNLAALVARDRRTVQLGVAVAAAELLVLCWFALFLAIRQTAQERRTDTALLELRGNTRTRTLALVAGQTAVPMLLAAAIGSGTGYTLWRAISPVAVVAIGSALLGALLLSVVAEWRTLRVPVADLLRRVPPRASGWQADLVDLAAVLVAGVGVFQARSGEAGVLGLAAPGLFALALGIAIAVALRPLAARLASAALRSGRLGTGLAAAHLARRRGTHRLVALGVVAVSLLATALLAWDSAAQAGGRRAGVEVGANRVLTVSANGRSHLLAAVRAADPSGREAMAVVVNTRDNGPRAPVVAVDATRLAAVLPWRAEYGFGLPEELAGWLHPAVPEPVRLTGDLAVQATSVGVTAVRLHLRALADGRPITVHIGPLRAGRSTYEADATGCAAGCRLVAVEPVGPPGAVLELHELAAGGTVVDAGVLGDPRRWRGPVSGTTGPVIALGSAGVRLELTPDRGFGEAAPDPKAYVVDAAVPLPVAVAGPLRRPELLGDRRLRPFGGATVPIVTRPVPLLPRAGSAGVLVDLEYADRVVPDTGTGDALQVWLSPTAGADLVDRLAAQGVTVASEDSVAAAEARYARQGSATASRFTVLAAAFALLLVVGVVIVLSAVERGPRSAELAALRAQGLSGRAVRRVALLSYLPVAAVAVLGGLAATAIAWPWLGPGGPTFVDGRGLATASGGIAPVPLGVAALAAVLVLGAVAGLAAIRLYRAVHRP